MMFVTYERTRTFQLCSFYFFCIMIPVRSFGSDKKKDSVFVSDQKVFQKQYRFEDFFWTGNEDDLEKETSLRNETEIEINLVESSRFETLKTTTVFHTTTIFFATVYPNIDSCKSNEHACTLKISPVKTSFVEFSLPTFTPEVSDIVPCPTQKVFQTNEFDFSNIFPKGGDSTVSIEASTTVETPRVSVTKQNGSAIPNPTNTTGSTVFPTFYVDQKYWIMTVLKNDNVSQSLDLNMTENKLSTLYEKALQRRQEKIYKRGGFFNRKEKKLLQPVKVDILNVTKTGKIIEIVYYVSVAGKPVPSETATNDMRLMTVSEVMAEFGHPILTKAEPYIKNILPLGARVKGRTRDTWLLIGSVIAAVLLLIILATLFALGLSRKQTNRSRTRESEKRKPCFEEEQGNSNLAFQDDDSGKSSSKFTQSSHVKRREDQLVGTSIRFTSEDRKSSSTTSSSCSGSSEASLVRLRHQQRRTEKMMREREDKPKPKPRTRVRKIENSDCCQFESSRKLSLDLSPSQTSSVMWTTKLHTYNYRKVFVKLQNNEWQALESAYGRNTCTEVTVEEHDNVHCSSCLMRSPTSYLSMPSVRDFPRGAQIPEPLNKVLEPISIRHFDADSDSANEHPSTSQIRHKVDVEDIRKITNKTIKRNVLTRHASLEGDDPGFIGPIVWNKHCQKTVDRYKGEMEEIDENVNTGIIKRRFNELLDDALSMFGSRNPSPEKIDGDSPKQLDTRVHSAVVRPAGIPSDNVAGARPKTTGSKRPRSAFITSPKGAWETPSGSTGVRYDTATVFQKLPSSPTIDKNLINVNSELSPCDPAIPLITAIKNELKKFEGPSLNN